MAENVCPYIQIAPEGGFWAREDGLKGRSCYNFVITIFRAIRKTASRSKQKETPGSVKTAERFCIRLTGLVKRENLPRWGNIPTLATGEQAPRRLRGGCELPQRGAGAPLRSRFGHGTSEPPGVREAPRGVLVTRGRIELPLLP